MTCSPRPLIVTLTVRLISYHLYLVNEYVRSEATDIHTPRIGQIGHYICNKQKAFVCFAKVDIVLIVSTLDIAKLTTQSIEYFALPKQGLEPWWQSAADMIFRSI